MTKIAKTVTALAAALTLSGCVTGGTATDMVTAGTGCRVS
jgi:PBP1b-binding outer membrane lipoprotein LpoB